MYMKLIYLGSYERQEQRQKTKSHKAQTQGGPINNAWAIVRAHAGSAPQHACTELLFITNINGETPDTITITNTAVLLAL